MFIHDQIIREKPSNKSVSMQVPRQSSPLIKDGIFWESKKGNEKGVHFVSMKHINMITFDFMS